MPSIQEISFRLRMLVRAVLMLVATVVEMVGTGILVIIDLAQLVMGVLQVVCTVFGIVKFWILFIL